jgi:hypothetical protein
VPVSRATIASAAVAPALTAQRSIRAQPSRCACTARRLSARGDVAREHSATTVLVIIAKQTPYRQPDGHVQTTQGSQLEQGYGKLKAAPAAH